MELSTIITIAALSIGALVEITPVKLSPLSWLGKRLNIVTNEKVDKINHDLEEHIADDMRGYILSFQKQLINKELHTEEDFKRAYLMCDKYELYIEKNNLKNNEIVEAISYIRRTYRHCLEQGDFLLQRKEENYDKRKGSKAN